LLVRSTDILLPDCRIQQNLGKNDLDLEVEQNVSSEKNLPVNKDEANRETPNEHKMCEQKDAKLKIQAISSEKSLPGTHDEENTESYSENGLYDLRLDLVVRGRMFSKQNFILEC
jgi:hypothetical protein